MCFITRRIDVNLYNAKRIKEDITATTPLHTLQAYNHTIKFCLSTCTAINQTQIAAKPTFLRQEQIR